MSGNTAGSIGFLPFPTLSSGRPQCCQPVPLLPEHTSDLILDTTLEQPLPTLRLCHSTSSCHTCSASWCWIGSNSHSLWTRRRVSDVDALSILWNDTELLAHAPEG